jgi:hypothetical protein
MLNMLYLIHVFFGVKSPQERYYTTDDSFDESDTWAVSVGASSRKEAKNQVIHALREGSYMVPNWVGHPAHDLDSSPELHQHGWCFSRVPLPKSLPLCAVVVAEQEGRQHNPPMVIRGETRNVEGFISSGAERTDTLIRERFVDRVGELAELLDTDAALLAESRDGWLPMTVLEDVTDPDFVFTFDPDQEMPDVVMYKKALKALNSAQVRAAEKAIRRHSKEVVRYDAKAHELRVQRQN